MTRTSVHLMAVIAAAVLLPIGASAELVVPGESASVEAPLLEASLLEATVPALAAAHEPGQAYMFLRVHDDSILVRLELLHSHLSETLDLGWGEDAASQEEVEAALDRIRAYAESNMAIAVAGVPVDLVFTGFESRFVDFGEFVLLQYRINISPTPDEMEFTFTPFFEVFDQHTNFQVVEYNWKTGTYNEETNITLVFTPRNPTQTLDLTSSTVWRGFVAMIWQGIWHIWIGLDHILFLVALVLPAVLTRSNGWWKPVDSFKTALIKIITIVTFFTIAHSVTLSMAALDLVRLPSTLVETIIALSIAAAALHNLLPRLNVKEAVIAFAFGLFHGFGFASVLGDIGLGREFLVLSLLGFNVGVEIGQVAIIVGLFPVLFLLRRTRIYDWIFRLGSFGLIAIALLWAAERTFGFNVPIGPIFRGLFGWVFGIFG